MLKIILAVILFLPIFVESKGEWSYENIKKWLRGNRYCAGNSQSPIDLQFNISHYNRHLKQLVLHEQGSKEQAELVNNGHTAQLGLKNRYILKNIAPESEDYIVEQIHFHWGHPQDDVNGSEHLVDGRSYPLEMHMVTYSSWYSDMKEAMANTRALAVVGLFFELSEERNLLLQPLVDALAHVRRQGDRTPVGAEFNVKALIGEQRMRRYYRYDGSLTTPPCYESVIWSVLQEPLKLSFEQLHAFRYLHDEHAKLMTNTYRTVRPLGTRKLFRSFLSDDTSDELEQRTTTEDNSGQYLSINMKLIMILVSSVLFIF